MRRQMDARFNTNGVNAGLSGSTCAAVDDSDAASVSVCTSRGRDLGSSVKYGASKLTARATEVRAPNSRSKTLRQSAGALGLGPGVPAAQSPSKRAKLSAASQLHTAAENLSEVLCQLADATWEDLHAKQGALVARKHELESEVELLLQLERQISLQLARIKQQQGPSRLVTRQSNAGTKASAFRTAMSAASLRMRARATDR